MVPNDNGQKTKQIPSYTDEKMIFFSQLHENIFELITKTMNNKLHYEPE